MSEVRIVLLDPPALLEFSGPDAVRFLNGQLTQDVRLVVGTGSALPACVTDAKGRLQFRVWITANDQGALWIEGPPGVAAALQARLTKYLIADDVEVVDLTDQFQRVHLIGGVPLPPAGVWARETNRFGVAGTDWWSSAGIDYEFPGESRPLDGDELEAFRIANGAPVWGRDVIEGILPPEAGLDATDISYQKGCYIGQEVISRIKSAGKVNKRLVRLEFDAGLPMDVRQLVDADGTAAGEVTSVSPRAVGVNRLALGYVKRGVERVFVSLPDGSLHPALVL